MLAPAERDHLNRKIQTIEHAALMRRRIRLSCPVCQHFRLYDAAGMWWLFQRRRWDDRLPDAARHFYCEACWRGRCQVHRARCEITDAPPDAEKQFDYPPEHVWKRLVSRYRS